MSLPFRVGLTRDFLKPDGSPGFGDIGLSLLDEDSRVDWKFLSERLDVIPQSVADQFDALLVLAPQVTAETLDGCQRLTLVARFGVGYDNVDVAACSRNNVLLTITPDGVRRPVAVSAITFLLALSHRLLIKDRLTRDGRWAEKLDHCGTGVTGRTLGLIGFGNIGREIAQLAAPFDLHVVAADPFTTKEAAREAGVELLNLDTLLSTSDFVCVCCALTSETHHLLDAARLALMKPSAFLINVARGPIIDQAALTEVLTNRRIAGAGLDVFEQEPVDPNDPILKLDNVIVAPHAICWTDELFLGNGQAACRSIIDVAHGRLPSGVVNRDATELPGIIEKLARFACE
jgi:phosphoglycerate dehydrogenase-like enzyme